MHDRSLPLTISDLNTLAETLEKQAQNIRRQVAQIEQTAARKKSTKRDFAAIDHYAERAAKVANWDKKQLDSADFATGPAPRETVIYHARRLIDQAQDRARLDRDRKALDMARKGYSNSEIAARLGCSEKTVSKAITNAFRGGISRP